MDSQKTHERKGMLMDSILNSIIAGSLFFVIAVGIIVVICLMFKDDSED